MLSTSTHQLHCPRCNQHPPLEVAHYAGSEIDVCPKCAGLWCQPEDWSSEQLGPFPKAQLVPGMPVDRRAPDIVAVGPSQLDCPSCLRTLTKLNVGSSSVGESSADESSPVRSSQGRSSIVAEIDQCTYCGGVWFDHKEMEHLEALREWTVERQRIVAETTWGTWWFQLFSQMPVEFNIRPRRFPIITAALIILNTLVFIYQFGTPQERWITLTARPDLILAGSTFWALLTSMFLHAGWMHLFGNMYMLYILGDNVEDVLGRGWYLLFYLICGLIATAAFVVLNPNSSNPLVGASGAIAGVMAAYFILFRQSKLTVMLFVFQRKVPVWIWLGFWFLFNLYMLI